MHHSLAPTRARLSALFLLLLVAATLVVTTSPADADRAGGRPGSARIAAGSLDLGFSFGCALAGSGQVRCWGENGAGQLAQGNTTTIGDNPGEIAVPVDLGGRPATQVVTGANFACALLDTGAVRCWGNNAQGQLAQGNTTTIGDSAGEATVAVDLGGRPAVDLAAGSYSTCATLDTGVVRCWGYGGLGTLAQGNTTSVGDNPGETTVAVDLGAGRTASAISVGGFNACAITDTGVLRCWGYGGQGQLAQGNTATIGDNAGETTVAVDLGPGGAAAGIDLEDTHACAILASGLLRCWGYNGWGQLAQGNTTAIGDTAGETTVPVVLERPAVAVGLGYGHTCVVLDTGVVRCAGYNDQGQLGQGNTTAIGDTAGETTARVDLGARTALSVAGGLTSSCALLDDRGVRCWGANAFGQLGYGSTQDFGDDPGEVPSLLPALGLGGQLVGRDTDGDGVADFADACPTDAGPGTPNGCAAHVTPPVSPPVTPVTPTPTTPGPATNPVSIQGKKLSMSAYVPMKKVRAGCPTRATVSVRAGRIRQSFHPTTKQVRVEGRKVCRVEDTFSLDKRPKRSVAVKVKVSGPNLEVRRWTAARR